jgi:GGDEF domain-containing protein
VVLPESEDEGAQNAAWRIQEHVANNREEPRISVSVGAAVYPRDGETISELLSAADRVLYERKAEKGLEAPAKSRRAAAKSA